MLLLLMFFSYYFGLLVIKFGNYESHSPLTSSTTSVFHLSLCSYGKLAAGSLACLSLCAPPPTTIWLRHLCLYEELMGILGTLRYVRHGPSCFIVGSQGGRYCIYLPFYFYSLIGQDIHSCVYKLIYFLTCINIIKYFLPKVKKFFNFVLNNLLSLIALTIEELIQPVPAPPRGGLFLMPLGIFGLSSLTNSLARILPLER